MSRPIGRLLLLLALWVQILAPVAAARAVLAVDGPLAGMTICGHPVDAAADADDQHAAAMPFCGLCCAAVAVLDTAPPAGVGVVLAWTRHVFAAPADNAASIAGPEIPRARGPPALA